MAENGVCMGRVAVKTPQATEQDLALLRDIKNRKEPKRLAAKLEYFTLLLLV